MPRGRGRSPGPRGEPSAAPSIEGHLFLASSSVNYLVIWYMTPAETTMPPGSSQPEAPSPGTPSAGSRRVRGCSTRHAARSPGGAWTARPTRPHVPTGHRPANPQPPRIHRRLQRGQARGRQRHPDAVIGDAPLLLSRWPAPHTRPAVPGPRRTRAPAPRLSAGPARCQWPVLSAHAGRAWTLEDGVPTRDRCAMGRPSRTRGCDRARRKREQTREREVPRFIRFHSDL